MIKILTKGQAYSQWFFVCDDNNFLHKLSKKHNVMFDSIDNIDQVYPSDIIFIGFAEYMNNDELLTKYPNNRFVIGGGEAYDDYFRSVCNDNNRYLFLFSDYKPEDVDAKNIIFAHTYWWTQFYLLASTERYSVNTFAFKNKTFLMPCRSVKTGRREWRQIVFDALKDMLPNAYYSKGDAFKSLPKLSDDNPYYELDENADHGFLKKLMYIDPLWYHQSYCSVVLETFIDTGQTAGFITEKTFKPIHMEHPFMIFSVPETLKKLRQLGFKTFDNIFDESYDSKINLKEKIKIIKSNLKKIDKNNGYDTETISRLKYNAKHFSNIEVIKKNVERDIIYPFLEWANG